MHNTGVSTNQALRYLLTKMSGGIPQSERPLDFVDPKSQQAKEGVSNDA